MRKRLLDFLAYSKIGQKKFEKKCGLSNGFVDKFTGNPELDTLNKIETAYPELNIEWLKTGAGSMLKADVAESQEQSGIKAQVSELAKKGYAPYYSDIPVSAGRFDLAAIAKDEKAESYIRFPGISAMAWFPVIGYSFEPKIHSGDVVGVKDVNNWDMVDPDRIYMIVTHEDRMIKRLRIDNDSNEILWCVSENYKEFKINVNDIKAIFQVVSVAKLI